MTAAARTPANFAIVCAVAAAIAFSCNDVAIKFLSAGYPLHQIVFFRACIALALTAAIIAPLEGGWPTMRSRHVGLHVLRGLCVVLANLTFFASIATLPLGDATAIFFVAPMVVTGLSVLMLGEVVGFRRWAAIAVGFAGVLILVGPSRDSFQVVAVLPLISAFGYALLHILTRRLRGTERASTMALYIQGAFIVVAGLIGLVAGGGGFLHLAGDDPSLAFLLKPWIAPPTEDLILLFGLGVASAAGGYLITQAYRLGEAGMVAPFEYLALIMAVFWGYVVFGEIPTPLGALGIVLILASGLFLAYREMALGRPPSAARASGRR